MATTWAGTASNQLLTRAAVQDGIANGYITQKPSTSFTENTRICTKQYIDDRVYTTISGAYQPEWDALTSSQCPTKLDLQKTVGRTLRVYASAPSGYTYYIKVERKYKTWNGTAWVDTTITIGTYTINSTSCNLLVTYSSFLAQDTLTFTVYTSLYANVQAFIQKNSSSCGSGTAICSPMIYTNFENDPDDIDFAIKIKDPVVDCGI